MQATTIKTTRETEVTRQRQPRKVLHMTASVNITAQCKKQAQKITDEAFGGRPPPTAPLGYATELESSNFMHGCKYTFTVLLTCSMLN